MSRRTALFAGPTLHGVETGDLPGSWTLYPPASGGDLARAAENGADRMVLVDGVFLRRLPPSPNEILALLRAGIEVWGTASLGALRAVELEPCGMRGHGWVYSQYRRRRLVADDEVMVTFDPESGRPLSEALVSVRYTLLRRGHSLPPGASRAILRELRALHFPDRTRRRLRDILERRTDVETARSLLEAHARLDVKRRDAVSLLAALLR